MAAGAVSGAAVYRALAGPPAATIEETPATDAERIALSHSCRVSRKELPSQSSFRVTAVVVYRVGGDLSREMRHVVGHNDEACCLLNSCCAERAAFLQLAGMTQGGAQVTIEGVYLTSDKPGNPPIAPGALCCEYMYSNRMCSPSVKVHMASPEGPPVVKTLAELYPFASPYARLGAAAQRALGERDGPHAVQALAAMEKAAEEQGQLRAGTLAWRGAIAAARRDNKPLHPISYGSCVVFDDGSKSYGWQNKALEYGCTLDAVCSLAGPIQQQAAKGRHPVMIVMADQHGMCHAPFAPARSFLKEYGFGDVKVLVHDGATGPGFRVTSAAALLPGTAAWVPSCG